MRIHSKLRSVLIVTLALATTPQIALPVLADGAVPSIKPDSGSYGPVVTIVSPEYSDVIKAETQIIVAVTPRRYPAQSIELLVDGRSVSGVLPMPFLPRPGQHAIGIRENGGSFRFFPRYHFSIRFCSAKRAANFACASHRFWCWFLRRAWRFSS